MLGVSGVGKRLRFLKSVISNNSQIDRSKYNLGHNYLQVRFGR